MLERHASQVDGHGEGNAERGMQMHDSKPMIGTEVQPQDADTLHASVTSLGQACALRGKISGDSAYADKALQIAAL